MSRLLAYVPCQLLRMLQYCQQLWTDALLLLLLLQLLLLLLLLLVLLLLRLR